MRKIEKLTLILIMALFMLSIASNLLAGIAIDPIQVETVVEQGVESRGLCKITNTGDKSMKVDVRAEDWLQLGIDPDSWLKIEPNQFILEPGKTVNVEYIISAPLVSSGEFMAMVFFAGVEEGSNVGAEFGIPIYASVKGTEIVNVEITVININYDENSGISGYINMKNNGNVHIRPYSTIQIINNTGKAAAYFGIQYGLPVQVGRERKFEFTKENIKLTQGEYKVIAQSEIGQMYGLKQKIITESKIIIDKIVETEDAESETKEIINEPNI